MRFLFVHQNFPGQYLHLLLDLVREGGHEIWFITNPNGNRMPGVNLVHYPFAATERREGGHPVAAEFEDALRRAEAVASAAAMLRDKHGFTPDIVLGHQGWGETLAVRDVWPGVPALGYMEFFYNGRGFDIGFDPEFDASPAPWRLRARNAINHLALAEDSGFRGQTPTEFQLSSYPGDMRRRISLIREGVDLVECAPTRGDRRAPFRLAHSEAGAPASLDIAPDEKVVTYLARGLEPYRGFHTFMRMVPALHAARKDLRIVVVGDDRTCYGARLPIGTWKGRMLREIDGRHDPSRLHFVGQLEGGEHLRLFRRADAHLYLTYPFVASWSLREALGCGTPIVASDTAPVREFVRDGYNGLTASFFDPAALATRVLDLFEDPWLDGQLRANARSFAERHLDMASCLASFRREIRTVSGGNLSTVAACAAPLGRAA